MSEKLTDDKIVLLAEATAEALKGMSSDLADFIVGVSDRAAALQVICGSLMAAFAERSDNPVKALDDLRSRARDSMGRAVFAGMEPDRAEASRVRVAKVLDGMMNDFTATVGNPSA